MGTRLLLDQRPLPLLAQLAVVAGELIWAPAILLGITLPALLVPDGRLRSPRWRVVAVAAVVGATVGMLAASLIPGQTTETVVPVENPFAVSGTPARVTTVVGTVCLLLHTLSLVAALLCVVLRFRASRGSSASSCAGSWPGPPSPWSGCPSRSPGPCPSG